MHRPQESERLNYRYYIIVRLLDMTRSDLKT